jgi:hypothetical protein
LTAAEDNCGTCDIDPLNDCVTDCAGIFPGQEGYGSELDNCSICDEDTANDCQQDCNGDWGGPDNIAESGDEAFNDNCNICDADASNDCEQDCNGDWGGPDNIPENGDEAVYDNCNICDADASNDCEQDCNGDWGGPDNIPNSGDEAVYDVCDNCGDGIAPDEDNDEIPDCFEVGGCTDETATNCSSQACCESENAAYYGDNCLEVDEDGNPIYATDEDNSCTFGFDEAPSSMRTTNSSEVGYYLPFNVYLDAMELSSEDWVGAFKSYTYDASTCAALNNDFQGAVYSQVDTNLDGVSWNPKTEQSSQLSPSESPH